MPIDCLNACMPARVIVAGDSPTCVVAGGIDPLCDDGILFAEKLQALGRDAVLQNYAGMPHGFMFFPGIDDGERSIDEVCAFLRNHLAERTTATVDR